MNRDRDSGNIGIYNSLSFEANLRGRDLTDVVDSSFYNTHTSYRRDLITTLTFITNFCLLQRTYPDEWGNLRHQIREFF